MQPVISIPSGTYNKTCFVEISVPSSGGTILYSTDGSDPDKIYQGVFAVRQSATVKAVFVNGNERSETAVSEIVIQKPEPVRGTVVIIGGAEHCKEIHQRMIDVVGGPSNARVAFLPTSSSAPYAAGMDRVARFSGMAGLQIDEAQIPLTGGKKDYSHIDNNSRFWIIPIAIKDDETTGKNVQDDDSAPLCRESTFPDIDESSWHLNARNPIYARKLLDGNYNVIFMTGGNQARYLECLYYDDYTETPLLSAIREILEERGGVVSGTSAGAAVLSEIMIQGGGSYGATLAGVVHEDINLVNYDDEYTPFTEVKDGRVWVGKGFGFLPNYMISGTHFVARGRIGRLLTAAKYLKGLRKKPVTGIGVDEDTAVFVYPDGNCEVIGALGALVIDTAESKALKANRGMSVFSDPFTLHYLEHGDVFYIDPETGKTEIKTINPAKQKITQPDNKKYYHEPDLFGHNCIRDFIYHCLIQSDAPCAIGTEIIDNTESSYDSILFHDLVMEDTILFRFSRKENTCGYSGSISYHWWGTGDEDYPRLKKEIENDRFSYHNIHVDVMRLDVLNFPDLSDSSNVPLKSDYLKDGYTEEEWQELFDDSKNYRLAFILIPGKEKTELFTFFFDYAYFDYSRNGKYSPPRLSLNDPDGVYKDYDIVQMNTAPNAEVYLDGTLAGTTDEKGIMILDAKKWENIKVVFKGKRSEYIVQTPCSQVRESILVFEEVVS
jgi:cyanophycinase